MNPVLVVNQHTNTKYFLHFGSIYTCVNSLIGDIQLYYSVSNSHNIDTYTEEAHVDRCLRHVLGRDDVATRTVLSDMDGSTITKIEVDDILVLVGHCGDIEYVAKFDHLICYITGTQYKITEFGAMYYSYLRGECWPWAHSDDFWYDGVDLYFQEHRMLVGCKYGAILRDIMRGRKSPSGHVIKSTIPRVYVHDAMMCLSMVVAHDLVNVIMSWMWCAIESSWISCKK